MKKPNWRIWIKSSEECRTWLKIYVQRGILRKSGDESSLHIKKTDHNIKLANWLLDNMGIKRGDKR